MPGLTSLPSPLADRRYPDEHPQHSQDERLPGDGRHAWVLVVYFALASALLVCAVVSALIH